LGKFNFQKLPSVSHYDPDHKIHDFYIKERKKAYEHKPLREEEPFQNVVNEVN